MLNRAMQDKLNKGRATDISENPRDGDYIVLPAFDTGEGDMDYCDKSTERWVWSVGRRKRDGAILASFTPDLYQNPDFECLWLR